MAHKIVFPYRTLIVSDVHLGTHGSRARELGTFLKHSACERLILNGDIVDGWQLLHGGSKWDNQHTRVIRQILKLIETRGTDVVYLRGNHDDMLDKVVPLRFDKLHMAAEYRLETANGPYLVVHGDIFDLVTIEYRWLAILGGWSYEVLIAFTRLLNHIRALLGRPPSSFSKTIKSRIKQACQYISNFEHAAVSHARTLGCVGIITGHIHTPADTTVDGIHYLNSGDWVESLSAIVEHTDGRLEIITYADFQERLAAAKKARVAALLPA